jgi:hypothetical protein
VQAVLEQNDCCGTPLALGVQVPHVFLELIFVAIEAFSLAKVEVVAFRDVPELSHGTRNVHQAQVSFKRRRCCRAASGHICSV